MKKEYIIDIRFFLVTQMNFWALFPIAMAFLELTGAGKPRLFYWILLSLSSFWYFCIRRYIHSVMLFLLLHALAVVLFGLIPFATLLEKAVYLVFTVGICLYSCYVKIRRKDGEDGLVHPAVTVFIAALMCLVCRYQGWPSGGSQRKYISVVLLCLGIYFLQYYLERYLFFLTVNESSTGVMPAREIFRCGMKMTAGYAGAAVLFLYAVQDVEWLRFLLRQVKKGLVFLLSLLPKASEGQQEMVEAIEQERGSMELLEQLDEGAQTSLFWMILEKIVIVVFAAAAVFLLAAGVVKLIRFLSEKFGQQAKTEETALENGTDVREKCAPERRKKVRERESFLGLSAAERIRRLYKKRLLEEKRELIGEAPKERLGFLTPSQSADKLKDREFFSVYEKARYSDSPCNMQDVRRMKQKKDRHTEPS